MKRFLTVCALTAVFAIGVAAQANLSLEDHAKLMKANAQAGQGINAAIKGGTFADATPHVATLRANYNNLQAFYAAKKKDDAVVILKDGLSQLDALDKLISAPAPDAMAVQAAMKQFQGNTCGACHKLYREGDAQTGFHFKAGF